MREMIFEGMKYLVDYPENYVEGEKYPIIIFLHGAGTRGTEFTALKNNDIFKSKNFCEEFPFIVVAPLCHEDSWFDLMHTLKSFVSSIAEADFADENRIYLMGNSMGGYGTWQLAMSIPESFAAIVPICGGGMYWNAERLKFVPIWAFHGENDDVVLVRESEWMVRGVKICGGDARLTVYPDCMHNSWTETLQNPEVFKWLLEHSRNSGEIENKFTDSEIYG